MKANIFKWLFVKDCLEKWTECLCVCVWWLLKLGDMTQLFCKWKKEEEANYKKNRFVFSKKAKQKKIPTLKTEANTERERERTPLLGFFSRWTFSLCIFETLHRSNGNNNNNQRI